MYSFRLQFQIIQSEIWILNDKLEAPQMRSISGITWLYKKWNTKIEKKMLLITMVKSFVTNGTNMIAKISLQLPILQFSGFLG